LSNDDITIDFEEKKVSSELGSKNITRQDWLAEITDDSITIIVLWQKITVYQDRVVVEAIKEWEDNWEEGWIDINNIRQYIK
jgi:hypothetical protein